MQVHSIQTSAPSQIIENQEKAKSETSMWGSDGFSFSDIIDIINPFQHVPLVNNIYREVTGDEISHGSRLMGGGVFGGVAGFIGAFFNSTFEMATGKTPLQEMADLLLPENEANSEVAEVRNIAKVEPPSEEELVISGEFSVATKKYTEASSHFKYAEYMADKLKSYDIHI